MRRVKFLIFFFFRKPLGHVMGMCPFFFFLTCLELYNIKILGRRGELGSGNQRITFEIRGCKVEKIMQVIYVFCPKTKIHVH